MDTKTTPGLLFSHPISVPKPWLTHKCPFKSNLKYLYRSQGPAQAKTHKREISKKLIGFLLCSQELSLSQLPQNQKSLSDQSVQTFLFSIYFTSIVSKICSCSNFKKQSLQIFRYYLLPIRYHYPIFRTSVYKLS